MKKKICHLTSVHSINDSRIFYRECFSLLKNGFNVSYIVPNVEEKCENNIHIIGVHCKKQGRLYRMFIFPRFIYKKALDFRNSMITKVDSYDEFKNLLESKGGFFLCHWDGTAETEEKIKADTKATIRCIPFDSPEEEGKDMVTGKPSHRRVLIAKAY